MSKFDPWGPVSAVLFQLSDSEAVKNIVSKTGLIVNWNDVLDDRYEGNPARIRKLRPNVESSYLSLPDDQKGVFVQNILKGLVAKGKAQALEESLNGIGWSLESGVLATQDATLSERFFPPGTPFDAYVAIRSILEKASRHVLVVDAYMGSTIFVTLRAVSATSLSVELLTALRAIKPDFRVEAAHFQQQFPKARLEVRTTPDFHDRFIVVDDAGYYHVGASIKDAGKRAFLISKLEDQPIIDLLGAHIQAAWQNATKVI
jgi:hypothetical protein